MCDYFKKCPSKRTKKKLNWDMDWFLYEELQYPSDHYEVVYLYYMKFH
jgi:hypothetical protein